MSDIPPELIEQHRDAEQDKSDWVLVVRAVLLFLVVVVVSLACATCAQAATFDTNSVFCETFAQDPDNGRYYIVSDPQWTPSCSSWVTLQSAKFQSLVDAYEAGGAGGSTGSGSNNFLSMSAEEGSAYGAAVLAVWAVAWTWRVVIKVVNVDGDLKEE